MAEIDLNNVPPPKMSIADANAILTAPGGPLEMQEEMIRGRKLRTWKNALPNMRVLFENTRAFPQLDYLVYSNPLRNEEVRLTYGGAFEQVCRLAHTLKYRFGVQKGDKVAIASRNNIEWILVWWATICIGAVIVPVNAWLLGPEMQYCVELAQCKLVFADDERVERLLQVADSLKKSGMEHLIVTKNDSEKAFPGVITWADVMATYPPFSKSSLPDVEIHPDDPSTILFTSGTTGRPKGALGTHRNYCTNLVNITVSGMRAFLRKGEPIPAPDPTLPKKVNLLTVPLFHVTGSHSILGVATAAGNKMIIMYKWSAEDALRLIQKHRVTNISGVPSMVWQLSEHPDVPKYDTSSLEGFFYGGAMSARELPLRFTGVFRKALPGQGYGMTETSSVAVMNAAEDYLRKPTSVGVGIPTNDVVLEDPETGERFTTPGRKGEVLIRGPNIVVGYYRNEEATKGAITPDGFMRTGDIGEMDDEGFIYIKDRIKEVVNRGGEKIFTIEVEEILYKHPAVMDAAVFGVPEKVLGEEVVAAVQVKPGFEKTTGDEIREHVRRHAAAFKVPIYVAVSTEPLLKNANGKVVKNELRKEVMPTIEKMRAVAGKSRL
ncbi:AMP-dependent synthetase and ligase [Hyaloraphidium curvatum]|nr:AMP-dependent synthetase and ligase [Hyaloraphidium curvatum]